MNQEQRVLLAVALSAVIFIVYQSFFAPPMVTQQPPVAMTATAPDTGVVAGVVPENAVLSGVDASAEDPDFKADVRELRVETDKIKAVVTTKGGVLMSYQLKDYRTKADADSPLKDLVAEGEDSSVLFFGLDGYAALKSDRVFQVASDETAGDGSRKIALAWQDKNLRVEKTFVFGSSESPYVVLQSAKVINRSTGALVLLPYVQDRVRQKPLPQNNTFLSKMSKSQPDLFSAQYFKGDKLFARTDAGAGKRNAFSLITRADWQKFATTQDAGAIAWSGITDRYFLIASAPDFRDEAKAAAATTAIHFEREGDFLVGRLELAKLTLNPGQEAGVSWLSYLGPKKLSELPKAGVGLEKAVDYGWFHMLATPILWLMVTLHKVIPNWGLVIIALTLMVKLALHPVNKKSLASMKAMQQLQPKMQEIKKRHPDDSQKQNEEIMQLFRTHKVNPMGGCLPMILQMPIYIVLYKVLWNAIELYHSPFLWYRDLSAPDPYFVAPVLLGVFMFLQQKLTPSATADPSQQKVMMFMPVMFSVFMLFVPVGLVVYIFVNTFMSVVQQFMLHRELSFKDLVTGKWQANGA